MTFEMESQDDTVKTEEQLDTSDENISLLLKPNTVLSESKKWPQHLAAMLASTISMSTGTVTGWSSPAVPYLQGNMGLERLNPITDDQASWVGSIVTLGCLVGAIPAGQLSHWLGRRRFLLMLAIPLIIGWLLIILGENHVKAIYLGRFICGTSFGAVTVIVPLYNNEIAEDSVRGKVGVYLDFMLCVGILWSYAFGGFTNLFTLSVSCCVIPIVFLLTFYWMPESPIYLILKGRRDEAIQSLRWLRGAKPYHHYNVVPELEKIQQMINDAEERSRAMIKISNMATLKEKLVSFSFRSTASKAVAISFGLMSCQRLSGVSAVIYYTVDIFRGAGTTLAPTTATIAVGLSQVAASATSALLVDKLGRRFLLLLSNTVMAVSLAVMVIYSSYREQGVDMQHYSWIPVVALCVFIAVFRVGLGPIPWFMMAELLPSEIKKWASSAVVCYTWCLTFLVTKIFVSVVDNLGFSNTYLIMCTVCVVGVLFEFFCVPETKNRSSEEIRSALSRGNFRVRYQAIPETIIED